MGDMMDKARGRAVGLPAAAWDERVEERMRWLIAKPAPRPRGFVYYGVQRLMRFLMWSAIIAAGIAFLVLSYAIGQGTL